MAKEEAEKIKGPFKYDYKWWDKNRPTLLPSTGLGKALKAYEEAKAESKSSPQLLRLYLAAREALQKAETAREAAVKKCGSLFKKTKAALENSSASLKSEQEELRSAIRPTMLSELNGWKSRLSQTRVILEGTEKELLRLIERVRNKDLEAAKAAVKILKTDGDDAVRQIRPSMDSLPDSMKKVRRHLEKEFPAEYELLNQLNQQTEDLGESFRSVNSLHGELREAVLALPGGKAML